MEVADGNQDIVHPEVRAHINSLVSAVSYYIYLSEINGEATTCADNIQIIAWWCQR